MHPYSSIDMTTAWKKLRFILSVRSDFHMIKSLSIAVHTFVKDIDTLIHNILKRMKLSFRQLVLKLFLKIQITKKDSNYTCIYSRCQKWFPWLWRWFWTYFVTFLTWALLILYISQVGKFINKTQYCQLFRKCGLKEFHITLSLTHLSSEKMESTSSSNPRRGYLHFNLAKVLIHLVSLQLCMGK